MSQNIFVAALPAAPQPAGNKLTKIEFISKFNDVEYAALLSAIKTDITMELWYEKFKLLDIVELSDNFIISGLELMVNKSIITRDRMHSILQF